MLKRSSISSSEPAIHRKVVRQRRARLVAWCGLGLVALSIVLGNVLIDRMPTEARFPEAAGILWQAERKSRLVQVLVLGSSRMGVGVVEEQLQAAVDAALGDRSPRVMDAAVPAGDPMTQRYMLERLLAQGVRPGMVVLEVSPEALAYRSSWMRMHVGRELSLAEGLAMIGQVWDSRAMEHLAASRLSPLYAHNKQLRLWLAQVVDRKWNEGRKYGQAEPPDLWRNLVPNPQGLEDMPGMKRWLRGYRLEGRNPKELRELIGLCEREGIEVVLLEPPVSSPHRGLYSAKVLEEYEAFVKGLHRPWVSLRDAVADEHFYDHHHVSPEGASEFTKLVAEMIVERWGKNAEQ
jgi:hypothetical protein